MRTILTTIVGTIAGFLAFVAASVAFAAEAATPPPDLTTIIGEALKAISTFKSGGTLLGMLAIVNVLTNATKLDFIDRLLGYRFWLRPLISVLFGAIAGGLSSAISGAGVFPSIIAGVIAGLTSTGAHEIVATFQPRIRNERAVGSKIVELISGSDVKAKAAVGPIQAEIERIAAIPVEGERLAALAKWANSNPV